MNARRTSFIATGMESIMTHRIFLDTEGMEWTVWDVHPTAREGMPRVTERLRTGWLALQNLDSGRRRVAPIPHGWQEWTDAQLCEMLGNSELRPATQRLVE